MARPTDLKEVTRLKSSDRIKELKSERPDLAEHPLDRLNWEDTLEPSPLPGMEGLAMEFAEWVELIPDERLPEFAPTTTSTFKTWREGKSVYLVAKGFLEKEPALAELRATYLGPAASLFD